MKNLKLVLLISVFVLLFVLSVPLFAQDATAEATVEANPVEIITVPAPIEDSGNDTVINVDTSDTPTETPVTPTEPMPWWASLGLEIGKLIAVYLTVVHGARALLHAFLANPARVTAAENAVNLVKSVTPDALEEAARIGAEKAYTATGELIADLRRALIVVTDGIPESSKPVQPASPYASSSNLSGVKLDSTDNG